ncbi:MAG: hypothetical protein MN733_32595 [Nitrososphaera sp.]|nr:hypothetical protein [Nitrososphaera sp.]
MNVKIEASWKEALHGEFEKPYWKELAEFVRKEYLSATVYPPPKFVFHAFELTPFASVRVVILGQDPYHGAGQAHGLCFSVPEGINPPPSLQNIYKEITACILAYYRLDGTIKKYRLRTEYGTEIKGSAKGQSV